MIRARREVNGHEETGPEPEDPVGAVRATMKADGHKWEFKARFRHHAFGWKSQPAIQRVKQAVITGADVWTAYSSTMKAAEKNGNVVQIRERMKTLGAAEALGGFLARILGKELGL
jgi:hypothetical protein